MTDYEETEDKLIAIPVVLKGRFRNHIVAVFVNRINNQIEFYDSKGLTSQDRKGESLLATEKLDLPKLLEELRQKYGATTIVENTHKHQYDVHNCGVFVCDYFRRRSQEQTPAQQIFDNPVRMFEPNNGLRSEMIERLKQSGTVASIPAWDGSDDLDD